MMTAKTPILSHILPIVLCCQENQFRPSCLLLLWMIWTCRVLIFRMNNSMQKIVRRFGWGIFLSLDNLRERNLLLRRYYMISSMQDHHLDSLLLGIWMKWGSPCVLLIQIYVEWKQLNLMVQSIMSTSWIMLIRDPHITYICTSMTITP